MEQNKPSSGLSKLQVVGLVVAAMLLTLAATLLIVKTWMYPQPFAPVVLNPAETQQLERKLAWFEQGSGRSATPRSVPNGSGPGGDDLRPEPYSEVGASREIRLTEREVNGMIAANTDLATRMAVDFANDLVSVKMLIPVDPDFPLFGGKTLKIRAGAELAFRQGRPVVILRGISVMGVPLPNAWLGGLKNIDLVEIFGTDPGFWQSFAQGVAAIEVRDANLLIVLKE